MDHHLAHYIHTDQTTASTDPPGFRAVCGCGAKGELKPYTDHALADLRASGKHGLDRPDPIADEEPAPKPKTRRKSA